MTVMLALCATACGAETTVAHSRDSAEKTVRLEDGIVFQIPHGWSVVTMPDDHDVMADGLYRDEAEEAHIRSTQLQGEMDGPEDNVARRFRIVAAGAIDVRRARTPLGNGWLVQYGERRGGQYLRSTSVVMNLRNGTAVMLTASSGDSNTTAALMAATLKTVRIQKEAAKR